MKRSFAAALALLALLVFGAPQVEALVRPTSTIARAIELSAPRLSKPTRLAYAQILHAEGKARHFDPLTVVAMVHFESHWNPALTNDHHSGFYVGLGQINAYHRKECREGGLKSTGCQARIAELKSGPYNLRRVAAGVTANRRFCRRKTGQPALFARWLSSYQGLNDYRRGGRADVWCNMRRDRRGRWRDVKVHRLTRQVMRYRLTLIRRLRL